MHGDLKQYFDNMRTVFGAKKPVAFRVPVIGGYTDDQRNCSAVIDLVKRYRPIKVELIKEHNLGQSKYISLGKTPLSLGTVTDEFMERYRTSVESAAGVPAEVCRV